MVRNRRTRQGRFRCIRGFGNDRTEVPKVVRGARGGASRGLWPEVAWPVAVLRAHYAELRPGKGVRRSGVLRWFPSFRAGRGAGKGGRGRWWAPEFHVIATEIAESVIDQTVNPEFRIIGSRALACGFREFPGGRRDGAAARRPARRVGAGRPPPRIPDGSSTHPQRGLPAAGRGVCGARAHRTRSPAGAPGARGVRGSGRSWPPAAQGFPSVACPDGPAPGRTRRSSG